MGEGGEGSAHLSLSSICPFIPGGDFFFFFWYYKEEERRQKELCGHQQTKQERKKGQVCWFNSWKRAGWETEASLCFKQSIIRRSSSGIKGVAAAFTSQGSYSERAHSRALQTAKTPTPPPPLPLLLHRDTRTNKHQARRAISS